LKFKSRQRYLDWRKTNITSINLRKCRRNWSIRNIGLQCPKERRTFGLLCHRHYISRFWLTFGRIVTEGVSNEIMIDFPTSHSASVLPDKTRKHEKRIFSLKSCITALPMQFMLDLAYWILLTFSSHSLCCIYATACDLEEFFRFDKTVEITSMCTFLFMCKHVVVNIGGFLSRPSRIVTSYSCIKVSEQNALMSDESAKGWLKTRIFTFGVAFHFFVAGNRGHFKFGMWVEHSKSQPTDDKPSLKWAWSRHVTHF